MLARFLYTPTGRIRPRRMIVVVGGAVAFAIFGTFLLVLTPVIGQDREGVETVWVLFSVFLLKFPLVSCCGGSSPATRNGRCVRPSGARRRRARSWPTW